MSEEQGGLALPGTSCAGGNDAPQFSALPGTSSAGGNDAPQQPAATGGSDPAALTTSQWATLVSSARGPIADRIGRKINRFTGDGQVDVVSWLDDLERSCRLESVQPVEMVEHFLDGNALRLFRALTVAVAADWAQVRKALCAEYGLTRQQAFERLVARKLRPGEAVDVFIDDLRRLASQVQLLEQEPLVRFQLVAGLPARLHQWMELQHDADAMPLDELIQRIRRRVAVYRREGAATSVVAAGAKGSSSSGNRSLKCFRCEGRHLVKNCDRPAQQRGRCYACYEVGHVAAKCPRRRKTAAASEKKPGFVEGEASRGRSLSPDKMEE